MKVAVITRHAISNYGSLLQAMATQQMIEDMGHSCEIIDYIPEDELYHKFELTVLKKKRNWNNNWIKRAIYIGLRQPEAMIAGKCFERFRKEHLKLSQCYHSSAELKQNLPSADVYMTGSDQVWGPVASDDYDDVYCLSFVTEYKKKIAYAASFGITELDEERKNYFQKWLKRYSGIAVREDAGVAFLESIGLSAEQVLDPTLLLERQFWSQFVEPVKEEPYILVYQLGNDKRLNRYAEKIARKAKKKLIRISPYLHQINRGGKLIWLPDINRFLSYLYHAECVITDSFHGTAFAINFNVPFIEILPVERKSRNISILKLTELTDRILKDEDDMEIINRKIEFDRVNERLESERKKSRCILKALLETPVGVNK